jgi:hypothetical protein
LGCWISTFYGPFSVGARFVTYELFISLIFQFSFSERSKLRTLNQWIWCTTVAPGRLLVKPYELTGKCTDTLLFNDAPYQQHTGFLTLALYRSGQLKADSHIPCHSPAMPQICLSESDLSRPRQVRGRVTAWEQHGNGMLAICQRSSSFYYHAEFQEVCYQKHANLRCRWSVWNKQRMSWTRRSL